MDAELTLNISVVARALPRAQLRHVETNMIRHRTPYGLLLKKATKKGLPLYELWRMALPDDVDEYGKPAKYISTKDVPALEEFALVWIPEAHDD